MQRRVYDWLRPHLVLFSRHKSSQPHDAVGTHGSVMVTEGLLQWHCVSAGIAGYNAHSTLCSALVDRPMMFDIMAVMDQEGSQLATSNGRGA